MLFSQHTRLVHVDSPAGTRGPATATAGGSRRAGPAVPATSSNWSRAIPPLPLDALLGKPMSLALELPGGSRRYFHGIVARCSQGAGAGQFASYQVTLRPWLWLLTRTSDCRIFQNQKVPDIIKQVFRDLGFSDFEDALSRSYREWEYCVQYRETSFDFVSRLMEQEGIYYWFRHEKEAPHPGALRCLRRAPQPGRLHQRALLPAEPRPSRARPLLRLAHGARGPARLAEPQRLRLPASRHPPGSALQCRARPCRGRLPALRLPWRVCAEPGRRTLCTDPHRGRSRPSTSEFACGDAPGYRGGPSVPPEQLPAPGPEPRIPGGWRRVPGSPGTLRDR